MKIRNAEFTSKYYCCTYVHDIYIENRNDFDFDFEKLDAFGRFELKKFRLLLLAVYKARRLSHIVHVPHKATPKILLSSHRLNLMGHTHETDRQSIFGCVAISCIPGLDPRLDALMSRHE